MSLDSVELLVEFEKYFNIEIANRDAEKLSSVQDAVDLISKILNVRSAEKSLHDVVFTKLQQAFRGLGIDSAGMGNSDLTAKYLSDKDKQAWKSVSATMNLKIPEPVNHEESLLSRFLGRARFDYGKLTLSEWIDVICAANYEYLIVPGNMKSQYEIYIALMGLTAEKMGVPIYIIKADKTFAGDLGID